MKKRLFFLVLALVLCMGLMVSASATSAVSSREDKATAENWLKSGQPETGLSLYTEVKTIMSTHGPWVPGIPANAERPVAFTCYGLKDSSGNIVLPANYYSLKYLGPNRLLAGAVEVTKDGCAVIDLHGNIIIPFGKYEFSAVEVDRTDARVILSSTAIWSEEYHSGNSHAAMYDWNGNAIFKYGAYKSIFYSGDGYFIIKENDGKTGVYEYGVGMVIPCQYRSMKYLGQGLFRAQNLNTGLCGVVDKSGKQMLPFEYEYVDAFKQGCFIVGDFTYLSPGEWDGHEWPSMSDRMTDALVDGYGKYLIPFGEYESIRITDSGYAQGGQWTGKYSASFGGSGGEGKIYNYTYSVKLSDLLAEKGGTALPFSPPAETSPSVSLLFKDVRSSDYFADAVLWAMEKNITNGTSATTFSPNMTCTQGEILTFLWRAEGSPDPAGTVTGTKFYAKAAQWAQEQGLTDNFSGEANCTRAMVVTYLWKLEGSPNTGSANFSDVPANASYAQAVAWAVAQGVTNGTSATTFSPDATCTRGQIVTFLYRALG